MTDSPSAHQAPAIVGRSGVRLIDHVFNVPLNHAEPGGEHLQVFAREAVDPAPDAQGIDPQQRPWLVYFQGGPGMAANRPLEISGWLQEALRTFRVLLLDQRGTGRSTPVNRQSLRCAGTAGSRRPTCGIFARTRSSRTLS